ncbi:hypothetical protein [uncultured Campylobacter sp.]|nr:hypothetical protein [uncultured Campylobacter sp.]
MEFQSVKFWLKILYEASPLTSTFLRICGINLDQNFAPRLRQFSVNLD